MIQQIVAHPQGAAVDFILGAAPCALPGERGLAFVSDKLYTHVGQVKDAFLVFPVFIHLQEPGVYERPYPEQSVIVLTIVQRCVIIGCQLFLIQASVLVYTLKREPILWGENGQGFGLNFVKAQSPSPPSDSIICRLFKYH